MDKTCKILIVSDSHGNNTRLQTIVNHERPFDFIVHCGDGVSDLFHVNYPSEVRTIKVSGNVDVARGIDIEREVYFSFNKYSFLVIHGDQYGVKSGYSNLIKKGLDEQVDLILFGHTHCPDYINSLPILINPGEASRGFYGTLDISDAIAYQKKRIVV